MKTLLINPNHRIPLGDIPAIEPPLWLSLMASHFLEDGKEVEVLDAEAENLNHHQVIERVSKINPGMVIIVVMGNNPSVSSTPKMPEAELLQDVLGKYVHTFLTGLHPMATACEDVFYWQPTRCLPLHWELLPMDKYRAHNWHCLDGSARSPYASIYTSLGCPFNCYYCNIHTLYKDRKMMLRDIDDIVQEVDRLVHRYNIRNVKIWDELFALNQKRVIEICKELEPYDLNIWAYARVDSVTKKMLEAMKRGGINWLAYGFENASSEVRTRADKHFSNNKVERAIKMTEDAGINIMANFMFGLPGETLDTARSTLNFAKQHLFDFVNFYVALPYPGSEWYRDVKSNENWQDYDQYHLPVNPWSAFRQEAFVEYFLNPAYLDKIGRKFGSTKMINDMLGAGNGR